nr:hypothetical protein [Sobelivirales sp.]
MARKRTKNNKNNKNKNKNVGVKKDNSVNQLSRALAGALTLKAPSSTKSPKSTSTAQVSMAHVCALVDPFCTDAIGVKYPDASAAKSFPYSMHYQVTLVTDVAGNASFLYAPGFSFGFAFATAVTGTGTATFPAVLQANNVSGLVASSYRIVSSGIRIRNLVAPLNASGVVQIRGYASPNGTPFNIVNTGLYNADFYADIPLQSINQNGHTDVILRKIDEMEARMFVSPTDTNPTSAVADWVSPGFGCVVVTLLGGPGAVLSALNFELFQHMEIVLDDSQALAIAMTPAPAPNPTLTNISSSVSRVMGNIFNQVGKDVETAATSMARRFMVGVARNAVSALPMLM